MAAQIASAVRWLTLVCAVCAPLIAGGCAQFVSRRATMGTTNPLLVLTANDEFVWESVVDVLHEYLFEIADENRLSRVIETEYKVGSGILEPWHQDSVGLESRLESSVQSIRRKVFVRILPSDDARGYLVSVEVRKEIEDLPGLAANSSGGATFRDERPLNRDLNEVVGQTRPSRWIVKGRDLDLEQALLSEIRASLNGER